MLLPLVVLAASAALAVLLPRARLLVLGLLAVSNNEPLKWLQDN
jgi:hypothetical protein